MLYIFLPQSQLLVISHVQQSFFRTVPFLISLTFSLRLFDLKGNCTQKCKVHDAVSVNKNRACDKKGFSSVQCCFTSTETIRLIRDGEKGGRGMEVWEEGDYIPVATLSPPE